jgi:hypothetical protein
MTLVKEGGWGGGGGVEGELVPTDARKTVLSDKVVK